MPRNRFVFVVFLLCFVTSRQVFGTEDPISSPKEIPSPSEFLEMPLDKAFPYISRLNKEEARELITQIRAESKKEYPNIDKLYFLLSHLEEIQAVEKEQARLESRFWVFGLGFVLFAGFLFLILIQQRSLFLEISRIRDR